MPDELGFQVINSPLFLIMEVFKIRQQFSRPVIGNLEQELISRLESQAGSVSVGAKIAVAVGSRGIQNLSTIVHVVIRYLKQKGALPFIIPAMGSHGGATVEGQAALLGDYRITEAAMECPIRSDMDVITLPQDGLETPIYMDRLAFDSDGVVLINRIKAHTDFQGSHESGLVKMSVIGLGKEKQAFEIHRHGIRGLKEFVPQAARKILSSGKILFGVGIIENAYEETSHLEVLPANEIWEREPELLQISKSQMPSLPLGEIDVLIVDQMGKNISGAGMDTNIIGRTRIQGIPDSNTPKIRSLVVTDLTAESHGNGTGIGLADVVTRALVEKLDLAVTYKNIVTSGFFERGKIPVTAETDSDALTLALRAAGVLERERAVVMRIRDTLSLEELYVSSEGLELLRGQSGIETIGAGCHLFGSKGKLNSF